MLKHLSLTAAAIALAAPVWAQTAVEGARINPGQVVGQEVETAGGERLGQVQGILWGQNSQITGVIVSPDESLGGYQGNIALDWNDITVGPAEDGLVANLTRDDLMGRPQGEAMESSGAMSDTGDTDGMEVPDISESQPGVIAGEDVDELESSPSAGQGTTE